MNVVERIEARLEPLHARHLVVRDDSALHAGHVGAREGGGHYFVHIVSAAFEGRSTVTRHRMIYDALGDMMKSEIHALAIRAVSPTEATKQPTP